MIKSAHIRNYQSWKDVVLNLVPGINVIVGTSDSGKSALLRAIGWVVFNRPQGTSFIRHGADSASVELDLTRTGIVSRSRGKSANQYRIGESLEEVVLNAVRGDVPEEVSRVLCMGELNIQKQLDSPFLLSLSQPDVARTLNEIANLSMVDTAMARAAACIRDNQLKLRMEGEREAELTAESQNYRHLAGVRIKMDVVKAGAGELKGRIVRERDLTQVLESIQTVESELMTMPQWPDLTEMELTATQIKAADHSIRDLSLMIRYVETAQQGLASLPAVPDLTPAEKAAEEWTKVRTRGMALKDLLGCIAASQGELAAAKVVESETIKQYNDTRPKECPLCGSPWKK